MKKLKRVLAITLCATVLGSCGGDASKQPATADGFSSIEKELKNEFGDNAYYTELTIIYNESIGNSISTTVTDNPESMEMGQWTFSSGNWNQTSDIILEVPNGTKAADFMFQLGEKINLEELGELIEKSKAQLTTEKGIENPSLHIAMVKMPKTGDLSKTEYVVMLKPENGGTTFTFNYALSGTLTNMDY